MSDIVVFFAPLTIHGLVALACAGAQADRREWRQQLQCLCGHGSDFSSCCCCTSLQCKFRAPSGSCGGGGRRRCSHYPDASAECCTPPISHDGCRGSDDCCSNDGALSLCTLSCGVCCRGLLPVVVPPWMGSPCPPSPLTCLVSVHTAVQM
jgi:hypothetical protein